jgi:hypothetical protein
MSVAHALIAAAAAFTLLGINSATAQLQAVGPISPDHGFPNFYVDGQNLQLAPCLGDPALCLMDAAADLVNPSHPFPANFGGVFPSEVFYNLAEGTMTTAGGGTALLVMGLFGTFANGTLISGDQFVNARIRLRIDNLIAGQTYHITTPYGVFDLVAQNGGRRGINFTSDVPGPIAGSFVDALNGPVGPTFLQWDSDLPIVDGAGHHYLGNPAVEHTITGSPFGTNFFRIQGPNVGGIGVNSIQTNLFVVVGMLDPGAPVADFAADPVAGHAPLTVNFARQHHVADLGLRRRLHLARAQPEPHLHRSRRLHGAAHHLRCGRLERAHPDQPDRRDTRAARAGVADARHRRRAQHLRDHGCHAQQ